MNQPKLLELRYDRAFLLSQEGRHDLAIREARALLAHFPKDAGLLRLLSHCYAWQDDADEAISWAERAIVLAPNDARCHAKLADAYLIKHDIAHAQEAVATALQLNPHNLLALAIAIDISGHYQNYQQAKEHARICLEIDPDCTGCMNSYFCILMKLERYGEAEIYAHELLARLPESSMAHANHGYLRMRQGQFSIARRAFMESLRLNPNNEHVRQAAIKALNLERHLIYCTLFIDPAGRRLLTPRELWVNGLTFASILALSMGTIAGLVLGLSPGLILLYFILGSLYAYCIWTVLSLVSTLKDRRIGIYVLSSLWAGLLIVLVTCLSFGIDKLTLLYMICIPVILILLFVSRVRGYIEPQLDWLTSGALCTMLVMLAFFFLTY